MRLITAIAWLALLLPAIALAQDAASEPLIDDGDDVDDRQTFTLFNMVFKVKNQSDYNIERIVVGVAIFLITKMIIGRRANRNMGILYVAEMDRDDGILKKQFAEAEPTVIVDGPETYKFYATGRRYCQGALFTFRLKSRQDLLASFTTAFGGNSKDILDIEVNMNESAMPSTVLFVGTHTAAKTITKENKDIVELTKKLEPTRDRLATWPGVSANDDGQVSPLIVHAEQASVFYEVMTAPVMDVMFGPNAYSGDMSRYFRYLHASSDYQSPPTYSENAIGATGKRSVVRVSFNLPPTGNYEILDKFVMFVCLIIDGLGTCKLTPEQVKKAAELRRTVEAKRESTMVEKERKLEERRAQKEAEERARLAKLNPEQREKERAKRDKILKQRKMKSMVKRM
jgi:hypothetical protein